MVLFKYFLRIERVGPGWAPARGVGKKKKEAIYVVFFLNKYFSADPTPPKLDSLSCISCFFEYNFIVLFEI